MTLEELRGEKREGVPAIAARHGATNVGVFGSVARGAGDSRSDVYFPVDFEPATGLWRHAAGSPEPLLSLDDIQYGDAGLTFPAHRHREPEDRLAAYLDDGAGILADPVATLGPPPKLEPLAVGTDFESLRWFWLPEEIAAGA